MLIFSLPVIFGMSSLLKSVNGITEKQQYTCITVGKVFKFNLLRARFSLLPFLLHSMSLCAPGLK